MSTSTTKPKRVKRERRQNALVVPGKRVRCPECSSVEVKVTSTPINTNELLHRWMRCVNCKTAFLWVAD